MIAYLVIEDYGFYSEKAYGPYVSTHEINSSIHSYVHSIYFDRIKAENKLAELLSKEKEDWEVEPIKKPFRA